MSGTPKRRCYVAGHRGLVGSAIVRALGNSGYPEPIVRTRAEMDLMDLFKTPYGEDTSLQGKAHLEAHGLQVVGFGRLANVHNIYEETAERAYQLARQVDTPDAEAVFISGTGLPTIAVLDMLEQDLGKPVLSSNAAMMWLALRTARVRQPIPGYGRLLTMM